MGVFNTLLVALSLLFCAKAKDFWAHRGEQTKYVWNNILLSILPIPVQGAIHITAMAVQDCDFAIPKMEKWKSLMSKLDTCAVQYLANVPTPVLECNDCCPDISQTHVNLLLSKYFLFYFTNTHFSQFLSKYFLFYFQNTQISLFWSRHILFYMPSVLFHKHTFHCYYPNIFCFISQLHISVSFYPNIFSFISLTHFSLFYPNIFYFDLFDVFLANKC